LILVIEVPAAKLEATVAIYVFEAEE